MSLRVMSGMIYYEHLAKVPCHPETPELLPEYQTVSQRFIEYSGVPLSQRRQLPGHLSHVSANAAWNAYYKTKGLYMQYRTLGFWCLNSALTHQEPRLCHISRKVSAAASQAHTEDGTGLSPKKLDWLEQEFEAERVKYAKAMRDVVDTEAAMAMYAYKMHQQELQSQRQTDQ
ncbi:hypothetical protein Neosp_015082 [[Neocosmospora] mangrovei]